MATRKSTTQKGRVSRSKAKAPKTVSTPESETKTQAAVEPSKEESIPYKKVDLIEAVTDSTGLKRSDVKVMVEATLASLADALSKGKDLNVPPLGKIRQVKTKDLPSGAAVHTLKLRRKAPPASGTN